MINMRCEHISLNIRILIIASLYLFCVLYRELFPFAYYKYLFPIDIEMSNNDSGIVSREDFSTHQDYLPSSQSHYLHDLTSHDQKFPKRLIKDLSRIISSDKYNFVNVSVWGKHLRRSVIRSGLSPHGYRGDLSRMHQSLSEAVTQRRLKIAVLGGSVPTGVNSDISWPDSLRKVLMAIFPYIDITVENLAMAGVPSCTQAKVYFHHLLPSLSVAHVILVDITVNDDTGKADSCNSRVMMEMLWEHTKAAILYFETYSRSGLYPPLVHSPHHLQNDSYYHHHSYYILRDWTDRLPERGRSEMLHSKPCIDVASYLHWRGLVDMRIPLISLPTIACCFHLNDWVDAKEKRASGFAERVRTGLWSGCVHPKTPVHVLLSEIVAASLLELLVGAVCKQWPQATALLNNVKFPMTEDEEAATRRWDSFIATVPMNTSYRMHLQDCDYMPTTLLTTVPTVSHLPSFKASFHGRDWYYGADVKFKPGWIIEEIRPGGMPLTADNSSWRSREIEFPVAVRMRRNSSSGQTVSGEIRLSLLHSYSANMGKLYCSVINNASNTELASMVTFDTRWTSHNSQESTVTMQLRGVDSTNEIYIVTLLLRCRADRGKVKIVSIVGC